MQVYTFEGDQMASNRFRNNWSARFAMVTG
jgi:hypothetical protein